MMAVVVDTVAPIVEHLLACLTVRLDEVGAPVCRAFWHPGATAPWDACGQSDAGAEGQAWVAVNRIYPSDSFPVETIDAHRCFPRGFAAEVTVGVLRCAATIDDHGQAPSADEVTDDALKVSRDRAVALDAIVCCLIGPDADPGEYRLGSWTPLGPDGGCVGGTWTVTVAVPACLCIDLGEDG